MGTASFATSKRNKNVKISESKLFLTVFKRIPFILISSFVVLWRQSFLQQLLMSSEELKKRLRLVVLSVNPYLSILSSFSCRLKHPHRNMSDVNVAEVDLQVCFPLAPPWREMPTSRNLSVSSGWNHYSVLSALLLRDWLVWNRTLPSLRHKACPKEGF